MMDHQRPAVPRPSSSAGIEALAPVASVIQDVLDATFGSTVLLEPVLGPYGDTVDFRFAATSPDAVDVAGRRGRELLGRTVLGLYPGVVGSDLWRGYQEALRTGKRYDGELEYQEAASGVPRLSRFSVRAVPCEQGLVVSWSRLDTGERERSRQALMHRLGRTGWVDHDPVRGRTTWSQEAYSIFGRDRSLGPVPLAELAALAEGEDRRALAEAVRRLLETGERIDLTVRAGLPEGSVGHVRIVAEAQLDAHGAPVEVRGLFQDLTAAKDVERLLSEHRQAALAHRSQLEAERELAARLQHTLLPVPQQGLRLADLTVDVAYQPVQEGLNLGGDWYSALELPDGDVLLVVGDVAGHGLDAVATMALLRFTAKGMAITGTPLPAILGRLNTLLLHAPDRPFSTATMIMVRYRPATGRLSWVQAGHLPPLLLRGGRARFLTAPAGILLGASTEPDYGAAELDLLPGDQLLLYTDGLIEHPGEPIDEAMDRLARTAHAQAREPRYLDGLVRALVDPDSRRDDICAVHVSR